MANPVQPLDLEAIFVDYFAGSLEIFMFLIVIVLAGLAAKYRMPNYVFLMMLALFAVFMAGAGYMLFMILAVMIAGLVAYWLWAKFGKT